MKTLKVGGLASLADVGTTSQASRKGHAVARTYDLAVEQPVLGARER